MKKNEKPRKIVLSEQPGDSGLDKNPKGKNDHPQFNHPMSAADFLNSVGIAADEPKKSAKKNGISTLTPSESVMKAVDEVVKWKKIEKEAKAERETKEADVIEFVQVTQDEDGFKNNYQKSYYVKGEKEQVTFVSADKFSSPKPEDIPELKEVLGVRFGEFVEQKIGFAVKESVIEDPEALAELRALVGDDKFFKFFEPKVKYVATDGFDRKRYSLTKDALAKVKELVPQAKPSIR